MRDESRIVNPVLSELTLHAIQAESTRAHLLHGRNSMVDPDMSQERRLAILVEEVGEVSKELCEAEIRLTRAGAGPQVSLNQFLDRDAMVKELVQVAAMAASWVEALEGIPGRESRHTRDGRHHSGTGDIL